MKTAIITTVFFLLGSPLAWAACEPVSILPKTGLTKQRCIDFQSAASPLLVDQLNQTEFTFKLGNSYSTTFDDLQPDAGVIEILSFDCNQEDPKALQLRIRVSGLSHELGHAMYGPVRPLDYDSRQQFVEAACTSEGAAVANNVAVKENANLCTSTKLPLKTDTGETTLVAIYDAGGAGLNRRLGDEFCGDNTESISNKPYREYYGDAYDRVKGARRVTVNSIRSVDQSEPMQQLIDGQLLEKVAKAAEEGPTALYGVWPSMGLSRLNKSDRGVTYQTGGSFALGDETQVSKSIVKFTDAGKTIGIIGWSVGGKCVTEDLLPEVFGPYRVGAVTPGSRKIVWATKIDTTYVSFDFGEPIAGESSSCLQSIIFDPGNRRWPSMRS